MDIADTARALVAPLVSAAGADLYDIEFVQGTLRVTVDKDGGVGIDVIGPLTRDISRLLDEEDPIPGQYTLEVSSPGLERALRSPEHFARAVGSIVNIKVRPGLEGDRRIRGVLTTADDDTVTISPETAPAEARRLAIADIERARTVFEWGPAPKPGRPAPSPSSKKKAARS